jgi:hypothetical protein
MTASVQKVAQILKEKLKKCPHGKKIAQSGRPGWQTSVILTTAPSFSIPGIDLR